MRLKLDAVLLFASAALLHSQAIQIPPATNAQQPSATIRTTTRNVEALSKAADNLSALVSRFKV